MEEKTKNVHAGHRSRMREKFLKNGGEGFLPHEILEMVLYNTNKRINTNDIAHRLIDKFGGLAAVFDADVNELMQVDGVGKETAVYLKLLPAVFRAYNKDILRSKHSLGCRSAISSYCHRLLDNSRIEELYVICVDSNNGVIGYKKWEGTVNRVILTMREALEYCLSMHATGAIIAHYHPGGVAKPSEEDDRMTKQLYYSLCNADIALVDHVIMSERGMYSYKCEGIIDEYAKSYEEKYDVPRAEQPKITIIED